MNPPEIFYEPNFYPHADALFTQLQREIVWDETLRARKTASFGAPYNYSQLSYEPRPMLPELGPILDLLNAELAWRVNNCLVNFYTDGNSTMGFHFDSLEHLAPETGVAIVSLGDSRDLVFRRRDDKTQEWAQTLDSGSLLSMPPSIQAAWLHGVRKQVDKGARISLTFRRVVT